MNKIFVILLTLNFAIGFGQEIKVVKEDVINKIDSDEIFTTVNTPAEPLSGIRSFRQFIDKSIRIPELDVTTVEITTRFTVCQDGSICDVVTLNETPRGFGLGEQVKRIIYLSGNWKPAQNETEAVNSYYILPIKIRVFDGMD